MLETILNIQIENDGQQAEKLAKSMEKVARIFPTLSNTDLVMLHSTYAASTVTTIAPYNKIWADMRDMIADLLLIRMD